MFFLLLPVFGHWMSISEFGVIAVVFPAIQLLQSVFTFGLHGAILRFYFDQDVPESLVFHNVWVAWQRSALLWLPCILALLYFSPAWNYSLGPYRLNAFVLPLLIALLGFAWVQIALESYRAERKPIPFVCFNVAVRCAVLLAVLLCVTCFSRSAFVVMWFVSVALALSGLWAWASVLRRREQAEFNAHLVEALVSFGRPIMLSGVASYLVLIGSRLVVNNEMGVYSVGLFGMAASLAGMVDLAKEAFNRVFCPLLYERLRDLRATPMFFRQYSALYCALMVGLALLVNFFISDILWLVGKTDYQNIQHCFPILLLSFVALSGYVFSVPRLSYLKRTGLIAWLMLGIGLFNVLASVLLVRHLGYVGAAWAFLLSALLQSLVFVYAAYRCDGIRLPLWVYGLSLLVCALGFVIESWLMDYRWLITLSVSLGAGLLALRFRSRLFVLFRA